jgi:hypothetical protein
MRLIPGGCGGLANGVYESHTLKPLLVGQFDLTNEVVKMRNQLAHHKSRPLWYIWPDGIDNSIGEVGIEAV